MQLFGMILEKKYNKINPNDSKILFLPPTTLEFFRFYPDDSVIPTLQYFPALKYRYVFIPFTNSVSLTETGDHWALLVWEPNFNSQNASNFYYLDSSGQGNRKYGESIVERLSKLYQIAKYNFIPYSSPQQNNHSDCGMFVMAFMECIAEHLIIERINDIVSQQYVTKLRKEFERKYLKPKWKVHTKSAEK
ncbi:hypothetical protein TVAG_233370 [Trichomonas vaginalis G3]|uniref:Ubiquitin-like protease family profile domain-containing protein n=1 Tax=Trichomonas vaginalis (strain ATCC PRA-98 / G3) TaxID=412133 RepID=A2ES06_TRIV3|nr:protease family [Trichomonas vaginalis G3]EAY04601.1 hypothetical protein TVAG_233370 [Trichomonas vaginalis G3]KAI5516101.1 protease family [Trichomonas vaginalis G3]|eukprot:XP_001316824.1 hypothetical protein [Trichomonas vaginalis G3]